MEQFQMDLAGRTLTIETGELAKQAGGAVMVGYGDTRVLVTATGSKEAKDIDFFPLTVDYEETNHLSKWAACICGEEALPQNHSIVIKRYGYVLAEKGMGRAGGERTNKLHSNRSQLMHILRNDKGHLPDTPANRELIESVANDPQNYVGTDSRGHAWYAQTRSDGTQVWAEVRDHTIINGGVNDKPKDVNETTGLKNNPKKSYLTWGYEE